MAPLAAGVGRRRPRGRAHWRAPLGINVQYVFIQGPAAGYVVNTTRQPGAARPWSEASDALSSSNRVRPVRTTLAKHAHAHNTHQLRSKIYSTIMVTRVGASEPRRRARWCCDGRRVHARAQLTQLQSKHEKLLPGRVGARWELRRTVRPRTPPPRGRTGSALNVPTRRRAGPEYLYRKGRLPNTEGAPPEYTSRGASRT